MSIGPSVLLEPMREALVSAIRAEMHAGGKLAALADLRKSAQFSTEKLPAAAVHLPKIKFTPFGLGASARTQNATLLFTITLAARSTTTEPVGGGPGTIANLEDADASVITILEDGNGNGLIPLLNTPGTFALAGTALSSRLVGIEPYPVINEGDEQSIWSYVDVTYEATTIVSY
jgi:hypothetical protein